jgi:cytochrome P450/NADPH-cytochrome P450 reductase
LGADRLLPAGFVDVKEDLIGPWEDWKENLISKITDGDSQPWKSEELKVEIQKSDATSKLGGEDMSYAIVRKNDEIAGREVGPAKRHLEVELPKDVTYRTGTLLFRKETEYQCSSQQVTIS